jgi:thiamine-phosphate pyrophosphorylase
MEASNRGLVDKRVYAMGGINFDNIGLVRSLGFGGVVVGGDLWNRFDILGGLDYKELISHFEKLRKAVS